MSILYRLHVPQPYPSHILIRRTHPPQWKRFCLTILPIKQPQPVIDKLAQLQEDNGEQHKRRRAAEARLAEIHRNTAMTLAECRSQNAKDTAYAASEHAATLNAQLNTTKTALNHMTLLWEHTERAYQMKDEDLSTELSACQSSVDQGKEREKGLSKKIDELGCEIGRKSSDKWDLNRQIAALEERVRQGTCGYQLKSGVLAICKAIGGLPRQFGAWRVASGVAKQQRKAETRRDDSAYELMLLVSGLFLSSCYISQTKVRLRQWLG